MDFEGALGLNQVFDFFGARNIIRCIESGWSLAWRFVHNIGQCSVPTAELWGILDGLNLAWDKVFRLAHIESDLPIVVCQFQLAGARQPLCQISERLTCQGLSGCG